MDRVGILLILSRVDFQCRMAVGGDRAVLVEGMVRWSIAERSCST